MLHAKRPARHDAAADAVAAAVLHAARRLRDGDAELPDVPADADAALVARAAALLLAGCSDALVEVSACGELVHVALAAAREADDHAAAERVRTEVAAFSRRALLHAREEASAHQSEPRPRLIELPVRMVPPFDPFALPADDGA